MAADGVERFVAIALAPQKSSNAVGYWQAVGAALAGLGEAAPSIVVVHSWHEPATLHRGVGGDDPRGDGPFPDLRRVRVMFTAHSLPARVVAKAIPIRTN